MKHTPLLRTHRKAGAVLAEIHGWLVPMRYGRQDIRGSGGLADWSWITTADVFGSGSGSEPPDGVRVWRLGGSHGMVTCEPSRSFAANEWMATEFISTTDVTGGYACFLLIGPHSTGVLNKLTSLDLREASLPDGHAAQSSVAHAQGIVLRQDTAGLPTFQILVGRDYGESVWHSILHAGEEFQITPIGVEDVRSL